MIPHYDPARSFDYGTHMWGLGERCEEAAFNAYLPSGQTLDLPTALFGWQHIDASFEKWVAENPPKGFDAPEWYDPWANTL